MKTYDYQKYFPKVLYKNFDGQSKTLFLNFLTDEYYNPRKLRLTKIKIDEIFTIKILHNMRKLHKIFFLQEGGGGQFFGGQFSGGYFSCGANFRGALFPGAFFPGAFFLGAFFLAPTFDTIFRNELQKAKTYFDFILSLTIVTQS